MVLRRINQEFWQRSDSRHVLRLVSVTFITFMSSKLQASFSLAETYRGFRANLHIKGVYSLEIQRIKLLYPAYYRERREWTFSDPVIVDKAYGLQIYTSGVYTTPLNVLSKTFATHIYSCQNQAAQELPDLTASALGWPTKRFQICELDFGISVCSNLCKAASFYCDAPQSGKGQ